MSASAPSDGGPTDFPCPVCLDDYSEAEGRLPLSMPCGHSTCSKCLRAMEDSSHNAETGNLCPTCRRPFGPVASLRPNFALVKALTALREKMKADDLSLVNLSDLVAEVVRREAEAQQQRAQEEEKAARKLTFADGTYEGDVVAGTPHGWGVWWWTSRKRAGRVHDGEWKDKKHEGRGMYTWSSGSVYDGEWKNGKREGRGKYAWADGGVYDGEWKDGKGECRGKMTYADGGVYDGEWKDGKGEGRGTMTYADGDIYDGEWKDDKREGRGKMTYAVGSVYDGEWKDGKREGRGTMTYADGNVYDGEWIDDKREGRGK